MQSISKVRLAARLTTPSPCLAVLPSDLGQSRLALRGQQERCLVSLFLEAWRGREREL